MILSCRRPALLLLLSYSILSLSGFLVRLPYPPAPLSPDLQGSLCPASPQRLCEFRDSVREHTPEDGVSARN